MADEARKVTVRLTAETSMYIGEMQKAGKAGANAMEKVEKSTTSANQSLDSLGSKAGKVGIVATALLVGVGKAAVDWESAWAGVTKTVNGSTFEMAALEEELRGLATTLPATHTEIAAVAEAAGQLGVERENIAKFTKTMIDLGETTNLSAEQAATAIAQISNVMGTSLDQVDRYGSALVELGNNSETTEADILKMAQGIAGAGAQINLTESDVLAISAAAASMGIAAEAGGSAISRVFTDMAKASKQGGESLDDFAKVAGVSAADFARSFEEDPARAFASFTEGLNRINESGGDVFTTLDELGLSDVRVSRAMLSMAASGGILTEKLDMSAAAWAENTALTDEAAQRYETTAAQIQVAWNKVMDSAIDAGEVLLPVLQGIATGVGALADLFTELPGPVKAAFLGFTALVAVGGLTIAGLVKLRASLMATRLELQAVAASSGVAGAAIRSLGSGGKWGAIAKGGAVMGGLALASSGVADKVNLTNTASLALMGTVAGPWGAAIGGGIGLMMDLAGANDAADAATKRLNEAYKDPSGLVGLPAIVKEGVDHLESLRKKHQDLFGDTEALDRAIEGVTTRFEGLRVAAVELGADASKIDLDNLAVSGKELGRVFADATPAMEALGISLEDLQTASDVDLRELVRQIVEWKTHADSTAGKTENLATSFDDLDDGMLSTADAADGLSDALYSLIQVELDQELALLAWQESVRNLNGDLDENSRSLDGNTDAGQKNREAILDRISALMDTVKADADAEVSTAELTEKFKDGREAILDAAEAADLNRGEVEKMVDQMNLTPESIETQVKLEGDKKAKGSLTELAANLLGVDRTTAKPHVTLTGVGRAEGWLDRLTRPRSVSVTVRQIGSALGFADGGTIPSFAGGGTVPGTRYPYGDKITIGAAPGEFMTSNRNGQADKNRAALEAGNRGAKLAVVPGYAGGGTITDQQRYSMPTTRPYAHTSPHGASSATAQQAGAAGTTAASLKGTRMTLVVGDREMTGYISEVADGRVSIADAEAKRELLTASRMRRRA